MGSLGRSVSYRALVDGARDNHALYSSDVNTEGEEGKRPEKVTDSEPLRQDYKQRKYTRTQCTCL